MDRTIWYIHPYAGGPGLGNSCRPYFLAEAWRKAGVNATVFCASRHHLMSYPQPRNGLESIGGVPYIFVPTPDYSGNGLGRLRNMFEFCRNLLANHQQYEQLAGRPDVIVASSPHPYCFLPAWRLARKWNARLVFEVRDIWPLSLVELAGLSRWHPLVLVTGWIEKFAYRTADHVVSLLPGALAHMQARGLPAQRFHYIPNGAGLTADGDDQSGLASSHEAVIEYARSLSGQGRFVVVYPGALGPPNNMLPLVEVAALLDDEGNDQIQFVVMGQGGERALLEEKIGSLGLRNFRLFPQAERRVALELMRLASAGYVSVRRLPIYRFGISFNKLFEYMQLRLPVVFAADVPENPVISSGGGMVTSPDDPHEIVRSLKALCALSPAERAAMGERGRKFVIAHHDYVLLAEEYLALLEKPTASRYPASR